MPAGIDREFLVEAFDGFATPGLIYQGVAFPVTVVEEQTALVTVFMQLTQLLNCAERLICLLSPT
jgi:hypothetical protein